jgi:Tfp pilus tip-associated adhesin PilY1
VVLLLAARPAGAACDCSTLPTLGAALDFPALALSNAVVSQSGGSFSGDGNMGVSAGAKGSISGGASTAGYIGQHPGSSVSGGGAAAGGVIVQDMTQVDLDARNFIAAISALPPTQTFTSIKNSTVITGNGCINVIEVALNIGLSTGKTLTIRGAADEYFIFNIGNKMSMNSSIILDGVEPSHVLFNVTGIENISISADGPILGTFMSLLGKVDVTGQSAADGAYISGNEVKLAGSAAYSGNPFRCDAIPTCPDPEASGVNIQTPATPVGRSSGNTPFYHAYYDTTSYEGHLEAYKVTPGGTLEDDSLPPIDPIDPATNLPKAARTPFWDAGIVMRTDVSRNLYTTDPVTGLRGLFDTANANLDDIALDIDVGEIASYPNNPASGVTTLALLRDAIIDYVHGKDTFDEDGDLDVSEMRSAVLGDIFHSNALFVGSPTTILAHEDGYDGFLSAYGQRDRVVYAGANDAVLHAFDAGAWWDPHDPSAFNPGTGDELFGYVPGLLLPLVKQTPKTVDIFGKRLVPGFVDGSTVAADAWLGDGTGTDVTKEATEWATVLLSAYREGGRGYLALDVTDPAAVGPPHGPYPKLLWEFTDGKMGQSWSRPVITRVKIRGGGAGDHCGWDDGDGNCVERWVAIFGAGHEPNNDPNDSSYLADHTNAAWSNRGKALFMLDLHTGDILAEVAFDPTVGSGTETMKYGLPSAPAVLDLNGDSFGDVVYIGDTSGQLWKWDISAVGVDGADADTLVDNFPSGVFFKTDPVVLASGESHYRSIYAPAAGAYVNGVLHLAFGTGERRDTLYGGEVGVDDNNRFYVVEDATPTGFATPLTPLTEAALTDITADATDPDPTDSGYYVVAEEGEKFFNDVLIFAGHVIAVSYVAPDPYPTCGPGEAVLYAFKISNGRGFFDFNATSEAADRRLSIGVGIPSSPRVTVASDPTNDKIFITTSEGEVLIVQPPLRDPPEASVIYWKQEM